MLNRRMPNGTYWWCERGEEISPTRFLSQTRPDLVLLDLMMPGLSGEEVLPMIKGIPVIVISAKSGVYDKVSLLLGGAADYMTKPFHLDELAARIEVQLRGSQEEQPEEILTFDDLTLNGSTHTVTVKGQDAGLTRTEYAILRQLMLKSEKVVTKIQLLDSILADTPDCTESSLKVHMSHLRTKLREAGGKEYIESVWGIGYKMKN